MARVPGRVIDPMAVTRPFAPAVRALRIPRPGRTARGFVFGALLGVLLVVLGLVAFRQAYVDRILPGVQAGGVDIGGMTATDARQRSARRWASSRMGPSPCTREPATPSSRTAVVGREVDFDGMLDRAAAVGRGGTRFEEALEGLRQLMLEPSRCRRS